jgi:hypothetical protein
MQILTEYFRGKWITHFVFDNLKEFEAHGMSKVRRLCKDLRDLQVGDYIVTNDGYVIPVIWLDKPYLDPDKIFFIRYVNFPCWRTKIKYWYRHGNRKDNIFWRESYDIKWKMTGTELLFVQMLTHGVNAFVAIELCYGDRIPHKRKFLNEIMRDTNFLRLLNKVGFDKMKGIAELPGMELDSYMEIIKEKVQFYAGKHDKESQNELRKWMAVWRKELDKTEKVKVREPIQKAIKEATPQAEELNKFLEDITND